MEMRDAHSGVATVASPRNMSGPSSASAPAPRFPFRCSSCRGGDCGFPKIITKSVARATRALVKGREKELGREGRKEGRGKGHRQTNAEKGVEGVEAKEL